MEQIRSTVFRATPPVTRTAAAVSAGGRLLRVGDAAAYVEPFTGEGIGWALASARLLAEAFAARPGGDAGAIGQAYAESHRQHFGSRLSRCRRVAALLRRPSLVSAAVVSAGLLPWAAGRMVPFLTGANLSRGGA
jgi:flavin-dependent dehydrogenase